MEAFTATIQMALFISLPDKPYFTCIGLALAKLYSNSLLAILNSRIRIEGVHTNHTAQMTPGGSLLAFYQNAASRRRTAVLPYASVISRKDSVQATGKDGNGNGAGPHVVDVRIQRQTEIWPATHRDDSEMIPMDETVSKPLFSILMTVALSTNFLY